MALQILGPDIYSKQGTVFDPGVATLFPDTGILVTAGTMHAIHRHVYCDWLNKIRRSVGMDPLTNLENSAAWASGVDLVVLSDAVLIRPDPDQIERVLAADKLLHGIVNKRRIRFLLASHAKIRGALIGQGDLWRIASDAVTTEDMKTRVRDARMKIGGRTIYYYSPPTGTRFVTLKELKLLAEYSATELHQHLVEIQTNCRRYSNRGGREVDFFQGGQQIRDAFCEAEFPEDDEDALRAEHARLCRIFEDDVLPHLRTDDHSTTAWLQGIYDALYPIQEDADDAAKHLGLAPEFHKHVKWLPGGHLKKGHLTYDSVYDVIRKKLPDELKRQEYRRARAIILNFVRDYGDLEHINIGWINESLSRSHRPARGQRDVYVVEMKRASEKRGQVRILRMEKWDMTYRLNEGRTLEEAMLATEDYTEYTQNRYLGCRRLGMNLFGPVHIGRIKELYKGSQTDLHGTPIWTPYFERAYVDGIASDKLTEERLHRPAYAKRFAELLGRAAATNIIVGRGDGDPKGKTDRELIVFFDDGDEIVTEHNGMIKDLIVTHHTGSFWYYREPLERFAYAYARPALKRSGIVPDFEDFAQAYLKSMIRRFIQIQREYRKDRLAFKLLFHLESECKEGSFDDRWECVLNRLDETDANDLKEAISEYLFPRTCELRDCGSNGHADKSSPQTSIM